MIRITLRQMSAFEAVVRTGSVKKAADELLLSQAAVSMSLRDLEAHLGTELFDRAPGRLSLSVSGKRIYERVVQTLRFAAEIEAVATPVDAQAPVTIAAVDTVAVGVVPGLLAAMAGIEKRLHATGAGLLARCDVQTDSSIGVLDAVEEMKCDFGLITSPCNRPTLQAVPILRAPLVAIVATDDPFSPTDLGALLDARRLALLSTRDAERIAFTTARPEMMSRLKIGFSANSTAAIKGMVARSDLVGILPRYAVDPRRDGVRIIDIPDLQASVVVNLIYRKIAYDTLKQEHFLDLVTQVSFDTSPARAAQLC